MPPRYCKVRSLAARGSAGRRPSSSIQTRYGGNARRHAFPALVDAIGADPKVRVAVHVGDIKSGSTECSDAWYAAMDEQLARFRDPLVYAVGDNEWTDCHRENNGAYDPIERLAKLRQVFFATPGEALGRRGKRMLAQGGYPENQLWHESRVTFAALHVVGSTVPSRWPRRRTRRDRALPTSSAPPHGSRRRSW